MADWIYCPISAVADRWCGADWIFWLIDICPRQLVGLQIPILAKTHGAGTSKMNLERQVSGGRDIAEDRAAEGICQQGYAPHGA